MEQGMYHRQEWHWDERDSRLDDVPKSKIIGGSRACVSIRGYFFADYGKKSLGAYRIGECARKSGEGDKKAANLNHQKKDTRSGTANGLE
jgi:hypothetical protein